MDSGALAGWIGGVAGGLIGLLGGVIGTWCSIIGTRGPRERAFMIKVSAACWILVGLFGAAFFLIPAPYRLLLVIPYVVVLMVGIRKSNQAQARIRQEETGEGTHT